MDEENADDNSRMEKKAEPGNSAVSAEKETEQQSENGLPENIASVLKEDIIQDQDCVPESRTNEGLSGANSHEINSSESTDSKEKNLKAEGNGHKDLDQQKNSTAKKEKPAAEPIVVPIVLRMSDFDHKKSLPTTITLAPELVCLDRLMPVCTGAGTSRMAVAVGIYGATMRREVKHLSFSASWEKAEVERLARSDEQTKRSLLEFGVVLPLLSMLVDAVGEGSAGAQTAAGRVLLELCQRNAQALLEEWIATRAFRDNCLPQDHRKLISNLKLIQDYLCSFESQGLTIVDISANSFPQTLDWLHGYLLQCIERGLLAACSESPKQGEIQST